MWLGYVIHAINTEIWWGNPVVNSLRRRDRRFDGTVDQVWSTFCVVATPSAKIDPHAGNVEFIKNEEGRVNV